MAEWNGEYISPYAEHGKKSDQHNRVSIDVNTSGHLNVFAYRLSNSAITVNIMLLEPAESGSVACDGLQLRA